MNRFIAEKLAKYFGFFFFGIKKEKDFFIRNYNNYIAFKRIHVKSLKVGKYTYGHSADTFHINNNDQKVEIGRYCSIAEAVKIFGGGEHDYNIVSTFPFKTIFQKQKTDASTKGKTIIGNDVWIGYHATVLSGVNIGNGAIVGAMSVVTKDVPPYAIVAGNPARIIKYRFPESIIEKIQKSEWWNLEKEEILDNLESFYKIINSEEAADEVLHAIKKI